MPNDEIRALLARKEEEQRKIAEAKANQQRESLENTQRIGTLILDFKQRLTNEVEKAVNAVNTGVSPDCTINKVNKAVQYFGGVGGRTGDQQINQISYTLQSNRFPLPKGGNEFSIELLANGQVLLVSSCSGARIRTANEPLANLTTSLVQAELEKFVAAVLAAPA